jgi:predicted phosphohydrolase
MSLRLRVQEDQHMKDLWWQSRFPQRYFASSPVYLKFANPQLSVVKIISWEDNEISGMKLWRFTLFKRKIFIIVKQRMNQFITTTTTTTTTTMTSMEHSPFFWETDSRSASQEIPRLLWNPKVYYHVHKSPPPIPNLSQINSIHNLQSYFPKSHSNIVF